MDELDIKLYYSKVRRDDRIASAFCAAQAAPTELERALGEGTDDAHIVNALRDKLNQLLARQRAEAARAFAEKRAGR